MFFNSEIYRISVLIGRTIFLTSKNLSHQHFDWACCKIWTGLVKPGLDSFVKHGLDSFVKHGLDSFVKHGLDSFVKHGLAHWGPQ